VTLVVHTLANDTLELNPAGHPYGDFDLVAFDPDRRPSGSTLTKTYDNTQLVVPHQGTYTIDFGTGDVAFVPDPTFSGSASAFYLTVPGGRSRFQVTVQPVTPVARNDSASTTAGTAVRVRVLDNDAAGNPARPLVPGSVRLSATGLPSGATLSPDRQTLTVPARGVFATAGDGTITFRPLAGVTGTVPTVGYDVADVNGTTAHAAVSVIVT
jgi:CshA-type fibril repeat protein